MSLEKPDLGSEGLVGALAGLAGEETGNEDVFVERSMEAAAPDAELFALLASGAARC